MNMKTLIILLAFISTHAMATSVFTAEELAEFKTHNFKMEISLEEERASRPNRQNSRIDEFRVGRTARTVKSVILTRATRPNRNIKQEEMVKLAQLF